MAITTAVHGRNKTRFTVGDKFAVLVKVTADTAYPEGGYAFNPASFGISGTPAFVSVSVRAGTCPAGTPPIVGSYDKVNKKLLFSGKGTSVAYTELCACNLASVIADVLIVEAD